MHLHIHRSTLLQTVYNKEFDLLDPITEQPAIRVLAEERYLAYVFLQQSGKQEHDQLRTDLKNQNRQEVLHPLGTFSTVHFVSTTPTSV